MKIHCFKEKFAIFKHAKEICERKENNDSPEEEFFANFFDVLFGDSPRLSHDFLFIGSQTSRAVRDVRDIIGRHTFFMHNKNFSTT